MRVPLALTLLFTLAAGAQTVHPSETILGPVKPGPRDRSGAVAVAPHGLLMAWSEIEPGSRVATLHTALFDFDAKLAGPIHTLPATRANVHATTPVIATDGARFFVAWLERNRFSELAENVAGTLVDSEGAPLRGTESFGEAVSGTPSLVWNGVDYRLFGAMNHSISTDGDVKIVSFGVSPQRVPFASPWGNGWIDWSNERGRPICFSWCAGLPLVSPNLYFLDYAILTYDWIKSGRIRETGHLGFGPPAVEPIEDDLLLVWSTPAGLKAQRILDGEPAQTFIKNHPTLAAATFTMAGSLIVFDNGYDVFGVTVNGDAFGEIFPISTGEPFDSQPKVYRLGDKRYLVTYVRDGEGPQVSLVSRFVDLP